MFYELTSIKHFPKIGETTFQLILQDQYYPDTEIRQRQYKKEKTVDQHPS